MRNQDPYSCSLASELWLASRMFSSESSFVVVLGPHSRMLGISMDLVILLSLGGAQGRQVLRTELGVYVCRILILVL